MVIESAERFGLSQLHQLRGRVGRGAEQSYCILVSSYKLSNDTRKRLEIMVNSTNGFEIAEADLRLRGHGDLEGTRQSGERTWRPMDKYFNMRGISLKEFLTKTPNYCPNSTGY